MSLFPSLIAHLINQVKSNLVLSSSNSDLDVNNPSAIINALGTMAILEIEGEERKIYPVLGASQEKIEEARVNHRLGVFNNRDGKTEISGSKEFCDRAKEAELAGRKFLFAQPDGSFIEVEHVTFRELSESEQVLLNNAVKIYLLYLQAIEDQERAKRKKESEEALIASASPNKPKHHDLENEKIKEKFSVFPINDYHKKPSTSKIQLLMQIQLEQLLAEREKAKENKILENKSSDKKFFLRKLSIVESSKKKQINKEQIKSDFIKTSSLTVTVTEDSFSELLILKKSPNTVLRALPK